MVDAVLVESAIHTGEELVRRLGAAHLDVRAAFWLYLPESETWRLYIASPLVDSKGSKWMYERIREVIVRFALDLSLREVSAVGPSERMVKLLRRAISTGPDISRIRFSRNVIDGTFVEDAYIYRMLSAPRPERHR